MFLVEWPGGSWEATAKGVALIVGVYLAALWLTLIFWTVRDIRQRTRDPIAQTVAVLLVTVFFVLGLWIYLILRPRFTLVEVYRTAEAPAQHKETAHYKLWRDTVADMMAEPRLGVRHATVFPDDSGW